MIQPGSSHAQKEEAPEVMKLLDALCGEVFEEITKEIAHLLRGNPDPLRMKRFLVDVSVSDSTNMADFCNTPSLNLLLDFFLEVFRCVGFAFPPHGVVRRQRLRHPLLHHRQPDLAAARRGDGESADRLRGHHNQ